MTVFVAAKSRAKSASFESNVFYTYKLKRSNKKKKYSRVMSSDQYQNDTVNRVAVISPLKRKKCTKLTNSPLPAHISNRSLCHTPRSSIDNAWRQQYLRESQSLLKLYMNSDYFEVDTTHNQMSINPERMYRRNRSVRIEYK
eukprot:scaffold12089_cov95-Skeletonema_dohrnii-CCMP3373.AAC.1